MTWIFQAAKTLDVNRYLACPDVAVQKFLHLLCNSSYIHLTPSSLRQRDRISFFVCFAPGICVQFHIVEMKVRFDTARCTVCLFRDHSHSSFLQWDSTRPDRIGAPLRIGCPPLFQDFDEMAEVVEFFHS